MDLLLLKERIQQTIKLGESQFREFKSALEGPPSNKIPRNPKMVAKDIAETLVAFANADGGELIVGVEDNGTITGIQYNETTIELLLEVPKTGIHKDTPLAAPMSLLIDLDGKQILYYAIDKSTTYIHQTSDGKCLQRKDRESCPVSAMQLQFERHEQISRQYDRQFVDDANVDDLDLEIVKRVSDSIYSMSPEKCLQYLGIAEYGVNVLRLRRGSLLLFAKDITKWHPRCQVRVVRVKGTELKTGREYNVVSDDRATGNILQLISNAWEIIRPHLVETRMTPDALFRERVMYPEDACREALINAITHRDYSYEGQNIEIMIFDDRMEIHSPGALLSTIHIDELKSLKGKHDSRNALIARVLREIGYVREMGEGMRRIFKLMNDADLVPPEIQSKTGNFSIILHHKSVFNELDQKWLEGFAALKLTREEMLIALMGKSGDLISPKQIYDRLNLVDWDIYRTFFEKLSAKGVIYNEMTEFRKNVISKKKGVSKREVKRLAIHQPDEIEKGLSELYNVLKNSNATKYVGKPYVSKLFASLPDGNPFKTNTLGLSYLLQVLGLIDEEIPTAKLTTLWEMENSAATQNKDEHKDKSKDESKDENKNEHKVEHKVERAVTKKILYNKEKTFDESKKVQVDLYVGNVDYDSTQEEITDLFSQYGNVISVTIPKDYVTSRGRGFCFVKMEKKEEALLAIQKLNGSVFRGRVIHVEFSN